MSEPFNPAQPDLPPLPRPRTSDSADDEALRQQERDRRLQAREEQRRQHAQPEPTPASDGKRRKAIGVAVVVTLAVALGLWLWLGLRGGGSSSTGPTTAAEQASPPVRISVKALKTLGGLGISIYWAGEKKGFIYELTKTPDNRVYIRYLPAGVKVGSTNPYLTVGTYPERAAFLAARRSASSPGSVKTAAAKGALAYYREDKPTNIFVAYPGVDYKIEVYDPSPDRARKLVASGQLTVAR